jgi:RNA polymerase sigma factor (sigma-70 family)
MNNPVKSFDEIYKKNYSKVLNFVNLKLRNKEIAEELTNDIFMKFHKYFDKFVESGLDENTYLHKITNSKIIDQTRDVSYIRNKRQISIQSTISDDENSVSMENIIPDNCKTPDQILQDADEVVFVQNFLNKIKNEKTRKCIELRYFEKMTYDEITVETGYSLEIIKVSLHRGLHQLKDMIGEKNCGIILNKVKCL